jgi:hypothetical protein
VEEQLYRSWTTHVVSDKYLSCTDTPNLANTVPMPKPKKLSGDLRFSDGELVELDQLVVRLRANRNMQKGHKVYLLHSVIP